MQQVLCRAQKACQTITVSLLLEESCAFIYFAGRFGVYVVGGLWAVLQPSTLLTKVTKNPNPINIRKSSYFTTNFKCDPTHAGILNIMPVWCKPGSITL